MAATTAVPGTRRRGSLDIFSHGARRLALGGLALVAIASFAVSTAALIEVAGWAGIPGPLRWAVPVFVDGSMIVFAILWAMRRARGEDGALERRAMIAFTAVSMAANAGHALAIGSASDPRTWVGAAVAALAPACVLIAIHLVIDVLVAPDQVAADARAKAAAAAERQQSRATTRVSGPRPPKEQVAAKVRELSTTEGLSNRQIAAKLSISRDTVAKHLTAGAGAAS